MGDPIFTCEVRQGKGWGSGMLKLFMG